MRSGPGDLGHGRVDAVHVELDGDPGLVRTDGVGVVLRSSSFSSTSELLLDGAHVLGTDRGVAAGRPGLLHALGSGVEAAAVGVPGPRPAVGGGGGRLGNGGRGRGGLVGQAQLDGLLVAAVVVGVLERAGGVGEGGTLAVRAVGEVVRAVRVGLAVALGLVDDDDAVGADLGRVLGKSAGTASADLAEGVLVGEVPPAAADEEAQDGGEGHGGDGATDDGVVGRGGSSTAAAARPTVGGGRGGVLVDRGDAGVGGGEDATAHSTPTIDLGNDGDGGRVGVGGIVIVAAVGIVGVGIITTNLLHLHLLLIRVVTAIAVAVAHDAPLDKDGDGD
mmetsp:Transcript_28415/g.82191  ORF Transcript_28415/g.82191 Transcript_28415/m.82191 type:complete len:333 (+) Transcript_28415:611-1609(+)